MKKVFIIVSVLCLLAAMPAFSEDYTLEATLEMNNVSVGNPVYLYVTFSGTQDAERPEVPLVDGLQIKYVGQSTKMSVTGGKMTQSITHTYLVFPKRGGRYSIGPIFAEYRGVTYKANPVELAVSDLPTQAPSAGPQAPPRQAAPYPPAVPTGGGESAAYESDKIFLVMETDKTLVYVNEPIVVTIRLYVYNMGLRDIEYPSYNHEGFSTGEFVEPERHKEIVRGLRYDVLTFHQQLFAIKEGDYVLGPAYLNCKMVVRKESVRRRSTLFGISVFDDDFFSDRFGQSIYPIELKSKEVPVSILPFPAKDKPRDFQGAVGDFDLEVHVTPTKVKVGDPVTVRMIVSGRGNLDTVTAPRLKLSDDFKTYEPQVTKKGGDKIYEQILIPKTDKAKEVPEVSFSFFNPKSEKYKTVTKGPFPLEVTESPESERVVKMVSVPGKEEMFYPEERIGKDIVHIKENLGRLYPKGQFLYKSALFWSAQALPLVLFISFYAAYRKEERIRSDLGYARGLRAPRKARSGLNRAKAYLGKDKVFPFYDVIFKTLQDYLGDKFNLAKGNVTVEAIKERLRPIGYDEEMLEMLQEVFSKCEMARYASSVPGGHEAEDVLEKVKRIIDYMEKIKL